MKRHLEVKEFFLHNISIYLSIYLLSKYLSVYLLSTYIYIFLSIYLSICLGEEAEDPEWTRTGSGY